MSGKVTLVGAGPGDVGLLTISGAAALEKAEVVIYDRLVDKSILALIPKNAEKIDAGKKSANHLIPQERMNELLLEYAQMGKNVVRLKGGDCFLFGRGGEELELLSKNNIEFEVIPGITSALAVPAFAGIPVTHRDFVSSVHIITGHAREGSELSIDFDACVRMDGTLVFLMGVANLGKIAEGLLRAGMRGDMPCAVIESGARPTQKKVITTLSRITEDAKNAKSPSVIVVGEVCSLSDKFDFFTTRPLFGKRVCVTRPESRNGTLSKKLADLGADVVQCPCIRTSSLFDEEKAHNIIKALKTVKWCAFTSPEGVRTTFEGLYAGGYDARVFGGVRIACVGSATAAECQRYGIRADLVPEKYDGGALGEQLAHAGGANGGVLLLRAKVCGADLTNALVKCNIPYADIAVYETVYCGGEADISGVDFVTFTSASTVKAFTSAYPDIDKKSFLGVCIGEKTSRCAREYGIEHITAETATVDGVVEAIIKAVSGK